MIKQLQRKFVLIAMGSLLLVVIIIIGSINGINLYKMNRNADGILRILAENDGKFPVWEDNNKLKPEPGNGIQMTEETPFRTRYFFAKINTDGKITEINTSKIAAVSSSQAQTYVENVISSGRSAGYEGVYRYLLVEREEESLVIFLDSRSEIETAVSFLLVSCGIALVSLLVVFILVSVFSKRAMRPVIESMEKQKQFITDAGHEIKTPVAIISANTEVLEMVGGSSEWTRSIHNQTRRLHHLVKDLLMLSKMEEDQEHLVFETFSLSDAVFDAAAPFRTLAQTQGKQFELDIQSDIMLKGDEKMIRRLVSILVDNAVKYAGENGQIRVSLIPAGKNMNLQVYNTCENISDEKLDKLFDRFYRADSSRARETGGYGIGLSIAKAIVEAHKGKIFARNEAKGISFTVLL